MKKLYTALVQVRSGRDGGARSADGLLEIPLAFPHELGGAGGAANPEQLFAAGFAACFASSVKAAAQKLGVSPGPVVVNAEATVAARDDGSFIVSDVSLQVQAEGLAEWSAQVLAEAKRIFAYSNATRSNTTLHVRVA